MLILCQFDHLGCGLVGQYQPQSNIRITITRARVNADKRCSWLCIYFDREICISIEKNNGITTLNFIIILNDYT
jgi:hypothetical protein